MFYYGCDGKKAYEGVAVSENLYHWEKHRENPLIAHGKEGEFERRKISKQKVPDFK